MIYTSKAYSALIFNANELLHTHFSVYSYDEEVEHMLETLKADTTLEKRREAGRLLEKLKKRLSAEAHKTFEKK